MVADIQSISQKLTQTTKEKLEQGKSCIRVLIGQIPGADNESTLVNLSRKIFYMISDGYQNHYKTEQTPS